MMKNESERAELARHLTAVPLGELRERLLEVEERVEELKANFMQLRCGGCAMEAMLEAAEIERDRILSEIWKRDPT